MSGQRYFVDFSPNDVEQLQLMAEDSTHDSYWNYLRNGKTVRPASVHPDHFETELVRFVFQSMHQEINELSGFKDLSLRIFPRLE